MDEFVLADSIVVNTCARPNDEPAALGGLPRYANTRRKCAQRNPILAGKVTVEYANAVRRRRIVVQEVVRDHISLKCSGSGTRRSWHLGIWRHGAGPEVRQVSVLIAESAIVLPAYAEVQRQPFTDLPIILVKRVHVRHAVTMNDSIRSASNTEETEKDVPNRAAGGVSGIS